MAIKWTLSFVFCGQDIAARIITYLESDPLAPLSEMPVFAPPPVLESAVKCVAGLGVGQVDAEIVDQCALSLSDWACYFLPIDAEFAYNPHFPSYVIDPSTLQWQGALRIEVVNEGEATDWQVSGNIIVHSPDVRFVLPIEDLFAKPTLAQLGLIFENAQVSTALKKRPYQSIVADAHVAYAFCYKIDASIQSALRNRFGCTIPLDPQVGNHKVTVVYFDNTVAF